MTSFFSSSGGTDGIVRTQSTSVQVIQGANIYESEVSSQSLNA